MPLAADGDGTRGSYVWRVRAPLTHDGPMTTPSADGVATAFAAGGAHAGSFDPDVSAFTPATATRNAFPPIDDYAFLSDCETNCLIARNGAVEWMCVPRPDSPSIFGAILDRSAGHFKLAPYGVNVPVDRRYLPGSLMVETTWQTDTG